MAWTSNFLDDDVCCVLGQNTELDLYNASSLTQQSAGRHVTPLWHIILSLIQSVFALYPLMLHEEATNTNILVFVYIQSGLKPTIYHSQCDHANHYIKGEIID